MPALPPAADAGLLNPEIAGSIDELGPDHSSRVWLATIEELPRLGLCIAAYLAQGDLAAVEGAAHSARGSAGMVGLEMLSAGMLQLVTAARLGDLTVSRRHWGVLEPLLARSVTVVASHAQRKT